VVKRLKRKFCPQKFSGTKRPPECRVLRSPSLNSTGSLVSRVQRRDSDGTHPAVSVRPPLPALRSSSRALEEVVICRSLTRPHAVAVSSLVLSIAFFREDAGTSKHKHRLSVPFASFLLHPIKPMLIANNSRRQSDPIQKYKQSEQVSITWVRSPTNNLATGISLSGPKKY